MTTPAETAQAKPKLVRWLIGLPVGFFAVLMLGSQLLFSLSPEKQDRWVERETIRQCWKEQERAPSSDKPRHFTDKADCERLEFDFKSRWGVNP